MAARRLQVDMIACDGHGVCAELLPEWITLDDWGFPMVRPEAVPAELLRRARWAVSNCPALALRLQPVTGAPAQTGGGARSRHSGEGGRVPSGGRAQVDGRVPAGVDLGGRSRE